MKNVRIGIVGIGNRGTEVARYIVEGRTTELTLTAVADTNPQRLDYAKENWPGTACFDDAIALMESGAVEAVLVAVPHYDHPRLCIEAMKRGLHVMCEKPAGVYTKAVREMNEFAKESNVTFAMMFNQRTNCVYRKVKEIIASGELGAIRRVNWLCTSWFRSQSYYDSGSWRATWAGEGGGVLANQCPHQLDLLQWICGMPIKVRAFTHNGLWHDIEVEDDVTAYLEYENGATGAFICSTGDAPGVNRFEITCDKGSIVCDDKSITMTRLETSIPQFMAEFKGGFGKPASESFSVETDGINSQTIGVLDAFAANIRTGVPLIAGGEEGINGLMLSNAMHLSSWLNETLTLPIDEDRFLEELNKRRAISRLKTSSDTLFDLDNSR